VRWSASALKRNCAYPVILGKDRVVPPDQQRAMDRGTEFHAAIERWQREDRIPVVEDLEIQGWIDRLAMEWEPRGKRLEVAWGLGIDGSHIMVAEPRPHVYEPMSGGAPLLTAGRADAAWITPDGTLWCVDWKTGMWPVDPAAINLQANAGGLALARRWASERYAPGIYYARDGVFDWGPPVELADAGDIFADIARAAALPPVARPGEWCGTCWESRRKTCASAQR
jgi:hypothetical protein